MDLTEILSSFATVGLDTSVFIYQLEAHPHYLALTHPIFQAIAAGQVRAVTSTLTLLEINVQPLRAGHPDIARKYEALLVNYPNLTIVDVDRSVAREAARIRADYSFRTPDAIQIAACRIGGADVFITNDRQLKRFESLQVILLEDFKTKT